MMTQRKKIIVLVVGPVILVSFYSNVYGGEESIAPTSSQRSESKLSCIYKIDSTAKSKCPACI